MGQHSKQRKQMEPKLSPGILICVFLAIAFGVYCLYPIVALGAW
jgi:hypothetical protein